MTVNPGLITDFQVAQQPAIDEPMIHLLSFLYILRNGCSTFTAALLRDSDTIWQLLLPYALQSRMSSSFSTKICDWLMCPNNRVDKISVSSIWVAATISMHVKFWMRNPAYGTLRHIFWEVLEA